MPSASPARRTRARADLRLASTSVAQDAGLAIPIVNDGYASLAPDAGAYEIGNPLPRAGPRTDALFADGFETP